MPTSKSAEKRLRQNETRRRRNQAIESRIKTLKKNLIVAIDSGKRDEANRLMRECFSALDKAAKKRIFRKGKVARDKSRLSARARRQQAKS